MPGLEVWLHTFAFPHRVAELAQAVEAWGFGGLLVADSQNLNADLWVEVGLAGAATDRIVVGPGVTNPLTRHPAVTASAAATVQAETGGRAVLGLGRGDSAVTQIGYEPVSAADFERTLIVIQSLLRGEAVDFNGQSSKIGWLGDSALAKVPVTVAATGPRMIAAAARHAEQIDFTVGAEPRRLGWAIETATTAAPDRKPSLGAFLNIAVHPDRAVARDLVRGSTAILARFATEGAPSDGLSEVTRDGIARLAADYDEARHGQGGAPQAQALEDDFIDRFAVVGTAGEVIDRLDELSAVGLERVIMVPGSLDADPALVAQTNAAFATEVLPALQRRGRTSR
jgi:5,10-methylenetetrahydromethanopterin reductase